MRRVTLVQYSPVCVFPCFQVKLDDLAVSKELDQAKEHNKNLQAVLGKYLEGNCYCLLSVDRFYVKSGVH